MKKLLLFLIILPGLLLADAVIFSGNDVKTLKPNIDLFGVAKILTTSTIPTAGLTAPKGSIAMYTTTGDLYLKTGALSTDWTKNQTGPVNLTSDVTGILPIANGGTGSATQNFVDLTTAQTVAGLKNFTSALTVTSNSANSLAVGPNGTTNPVFQVDSSTASQANGLKITGTAAAAGVNVAAVSSNANEGINLTSKGTGAVAVQVGGTSKYTASASSNVFSVSTSSSATNRFQVNSNTDTSLTASSEATHTHFNLSPTRQHATGALTLQRDFRVTPSAHSFVGASTLTNAAALAIDGPSNGGTNATITNSSALYIPTSLVTNVTNSYGVNVAATTGATNNYAAAFTGGSVGIGTTAPASLLHTLENNSASGNSNGLTVEQAGTGDALAHFLLTGVQRYTMGIDNSDADKFKLGTNADLGSNNLLTITTTGLVGVGTATPNTSAVKTFNKLIDVASVTDSEIIGLNLKVLDGINNRRVGFFLDDATGDYGFDSTASSGTPNFVIQSVGSEKMRVTSGGNVGIGLTSPSSRLDIATEGTSSTAAITGYGTSSAGFFNARAARGTIAAPTASQIYDNLGGFNVGGYGATAFAGSRLSIRGFAAENWTDAAQGTYWSFLTTPAGTASAVEVMRLNSSGNLGLGTTNPLVRLDIVGTAANQFRISDTTADATQKLSYISGRHYTNAQADVLQILGGNAVSANTMSYGGGSGSMNSVTEHRFYTGATNTTLTGTQRMTINSAGNVGIGVTSPNANAILDVTSTTKAFMPPRMTTAQKNSVATPTAGMVVYDTDMKGISFYNGTAWTTTNNKNVATKTANYTALQSDDVLLGDATSGAITITLPTAVGNTGEVFHIKKIDSSVNAVTIATTSSQTIDGVTTQSIGVQYKNITVVSDGSNWSIL